MAAKGEPKKEKELEENIGGYFYTSGYLSFDLIVPLLDVCSEQICNIYKCVIFIRKKLSILNV